MLHWRCSPGLKTIRDIDKMRLIIPGSALMTVRIVRLYAHFDYLLGMVKQLQAAAINQSNAENLGQNKLFLAMHCR